MRLTTPRLLIRDFVPEDWRAVQGYAADEEAVRYRPFGPCTDEETEAVIREVAKQIHQLDRTSYDLAIVIAADGALIGGCDIGLLSNDQSEATLGYGLNRAYWGKGYMTEAAGALLVLGFETLLAKCISADVEPANAASVHVLEKIGMCCIDRGQQWIKGQQRSVLHYSITSEEWQISNPLPNVVIEG